MDAAPREDEVKEALSTVMHPAINLSLMDLGIVKDVDVSGDKVLITLAFPAPGIPIADMLAESVRRPVEELGMSAEVEITVMTPEEIQRFLALEQQNWKGM